MHALVINAGSSSIKFAVFAGGSAGERTVAAVPFLQGEFERIGLADTQWKLKDVLSGTMLENGTPIAAGEPANHAACMATLAARLAAMQVSIDCAGHRVVHGGALFSHPVEINESSLASLEQLTNLAPLHQPHNLAGIWALRKALPGIPQVACFDTAFHTTQSRLQQIFALPREMTDQGIRAYGFHGLSYEYIAGQPELAQHQRVVVAHLGNGASLCAIKERRSVATTMGFTALDGLPMGTRTGSIDPGVLLHLMNAGMCAKELETLLYKKSGLLGMSGISSDVRDLLGSEDPRAVEAIEYFCERTAQHVARMAVTLRGLDALVFTAGIGENAPSIRAAICERLAFLGIDFSSERNEGQPKSKAPFERSISASGSKVPVYVIPANEEWVIASHAAELRS
jgi:acetate kinase